MIFYLEDIGHKTNLIVCSDLTLLHFAAQTAGWSTGATGNEIKFASYKNVNLKIK